MKTYVKNINNEIIFSGNFDSFVEAIVMNKNNLRWANLRGADLQEANLRGADLQEANLQWADLRGADLRGADLRGADLRGADLRGADLQEANLQWADLRGADLQRAFINVGEPLTITPYQLSNLKWPILITPLYMRIGCQNHTHVQWEQFNDEFISKMHNEALDWWKTFKTPLLELCRIHKKESEKVK